MGKQKMNQEAASGIQSHADRTGRNANFKSGAQRTAAKNEEYYFFSIISPFFLF